MLSLVWRSDLHLADQPPVSRTDDWAATLLGKLVQVGQIAREVGAEGVLDGGDFYHIKSPVRTTHALQQRVAEVHAAYPCPTWGCIGNHDVKYADYTFLAEAPLGVLFTSGVFRRLYDEHEAVFEKGNVKVRVVGIPFHGVRYDMDRFSRIERGDETYLVVVAHLLASRLGGEMFAGEDIVRYAELPEAPDLFLFGHWHKNQGIVALDKRRTVVNIGSMSRGALTQDDTTRIPEVAVLRFFDNKIEVETRPLFVEPAEKVFDLDGRFRAEARTMTADAFVESLKATLAPSATKPLIDVVRDLDIPPEIKERALLYLEQAHAPA